MKRMVIDVMCILLILIMPMWLMELLKIDVSIQKIIAESEDNKVESED